MAIRLDPQGAEVKLLNRAAGSFTGQRVLEIGAGNGRLTWQYAPRAATVTAVDPDRETVLQAQQDCPEALRGRVNFLHASILDLKPSNPKDAYDVAIFSWSL